MVSLAESLRATRLGRLRGFPHDREPGRAGRGTAAGGLEDGSKLTGTATWGSRKWTWSATIEDGVMRGKRTELRNRNRTYETGTFVLSR